MTSEAFYLNRVVIPHLVHLRSPEVVGLEKLPADGDYAWGLAIEEFNPDALNIYTNVLFSQAAEKIYVVSSDKDTFNEHISSMPFVGKLRIQLADRKGKIYKDVRNFLKPIFNDAILAGSYVPAIERDRFFERTAHSNLRNSGHLLTRLAKETFLICVATKLKAQVDVNLPEYRKLIKASKGLPLSQESISRLSILEGIFAPYKRTVVDSFQISKDFTGKNVSERLFDLLEDTKVHDMSHERYLLGVPAKLKLAKRRLTMLVREILSRRKYRSLLAAGQDVVAAATSLPISGSALTDVLIGDSYSPPITSLAKLKPQARTYVVRDDEMIVRILGDDSAIKLARARNFELRVRYKEYLDELLPDFTFGEDS